MEENKYEAALERAKSAIKECGDNVGRIRMIESIFPELKKSEGEQVRNWLIGWARAVNWSEQFSVTKEQVIAWLGKLKDFDKQLDEAYQTANAVVYKKGYDDGYLEGIVNAKKEFEKSKPTVIDIDKMVSKYANTKESVTNGLPVNCQIRAYRKGINDALNLLLDIEKPITIGKRRAVSGKLKELIDNKDPKSIEETKKKMLEETEPKFKVGDWITNSIETVQITWYDIDYGYQVDCKGNLQHRDTDIIEKEYHLWSIADAKHGDVLVCCDNKPFIFKGFFDLNFPNCLAAYCGVTLENQFGHCNGKTFWTNQDVKPATKEQCNLLFQKMHEAGYEWDDERKEIKKIPKFKVGDWITNSIETVQITWYDIDYGYQVDCKGNLQHRDTDIIEKEYHLWTIQDAKDGDVLQLGKVTAIFKKYIGNGNCKCYCSVYDVEFEIPNTDNSYGCHNAVPATKEQRELLFRKMEEDGYFWNSVTKELSQISVTKKSDKVWNEDDEKNLQGVIDEIQANKSSAPEYDLKTYDKFLSWLKSIKERVQPQPKQVEWSEEDEEMKDLIDEISCQNDDVDYETHVRITRWLNELKQRLS